MIWYLCALQMLTIVNVEAACHHTKFLQYCFPMLKFHPCDLFCNWKFVISWSLLPMCLALFLLRNAVYHFFVGNFFIRLFLRFSFWIWISEGPSPIPFWLGIYTFWCCSLMYFVSFGQFLAIMFLKYCIFPILFLNISGTSVTQC